MNTRITLPTGIIQAITELAGIPYTEVKSLYIEPQLGSITIRTTNNKRHYINIQ